MINPTSNSVEAIARFLIEEGASEVYLFGSANLKSEESPSDIDLAVSGLPADRFYVVVGKLLERFEEPIDLIDLDEETRFSRFIKSKGDLQIVLRSAGSN